MNYGTYKHFDLKEIRMKLILNTFIAPFLNLIYRKYD